MLVLGVNRTVTAEEVLVIKPPPTVLNTTAPEMVDTGVSPAPVEGAICTTVGDGLVAAVIKLATAFDIVGATEAIDADVVETGPEDVVVPFICLFAIYTNLLANTGVTE